MLKINCADGPYYCQKSTAMQNCVLAMFITRSDDEEITSHFSIDSMELLFVIIAALKRSKNPQAIISAVVGRKCFADHVMLLVLVDYYQIQMSNAIMQRMLKISSGNSSELDCLLEIFNSETVTRICKHWYLQFEKPLPDPRILQYFDFVKLLKENSGAIREMIRRYLKLGGEWQQKIEDIISKTSCIDIFIRFHRTNPNAEKLQLWKLYEQYHGRQLCLSIEHVFSFLEFAKFIGGIKLDEFEIITNHNLAHEVFI